MDLLIGITIGSILTNITQYSNHRGGTLPEEIEVVDHIIRTRNLGPRVGRFIKPNLYRVQPTNDELRKRIRNWMDPNIPNAAKNEWNHISRWDTSRITDMEYLFYEATTFNEPIGEWDTSNVTNMGGMFEGAKRFNQPIGKWDTSNVTDMALMFKGA